MQPIFGPPVPPRRLNKSSYYFVPSLVPSNLRRAHLRRLLDIFHLSLLRGDVARARRAWSIAGRCREVWWYEDGGALLRNEERLAWLQSVRSLKGPRLDPNHATESLKELVLELVSRSRETEALDELELFVFFSSCGNCNAVLNLQISSKGTFHRIPMLNRPFYMYMPGCLPCFSLSPLRNVPLNVADEPHRRRPLRLLLDVRRRSLSAFQVSFRYLITC
jgi:hypothetical protein